MNLLYIGLGGAFGAISRYLLGTWVHIHFDSKLFPFGTVTVNILGCLLIGFLGGFFEAKPILSDQARLMIFIGLLGGFTTFSTFGHETFRMIQDTEIIKAIIYVTLSIIFGLSAVWIGHNLSKLV